MKASLELLWNSYAKKCWLVELAIYLCFLATLVAFSLVVHDTFHDDHAEHGASIMFKVAYPMVTLATGAFGSYLARAEYFETNVILQRVREAGKGKDVECTTWELVYDKIGMSNVLDIVIAALAVMCSASALAFTPGPLLVSVLSVHVFLSVVNL
jgi:hypothetical protein